MNFNQEMTKLTSKGELIVDTRPILNTQFLITSWQQGIKFYSKEHGQWIQNTSDPGFTLVTDEYLERENEPIQKYLRHIPPWLFSRAKLYQYKQFTLLSYLSQYQELHDIFKHSTTLVWLAICHCSHQGQPTQKTISLLQSKRENIVKRLTGVVNKSVIKFIHKIILDEGNEKEYRLIRYSITNKEYILYFSHWKSIPIQALAVVKKYPVFIKTKLLIHLIKTNEPVYKQLGLFSRVNQIIIDIKQMANQLKIPLPSHYFNQFKTESELEMAHDRYVIKFNKSDIVARVDCLFFPLSPLEDTEHIKHIITNHDLAEEGKVMHHCVGGYVRRAQKGHSYFYQVLYPERGTLQISIKNNKLMIEQFKLAYNRIPSEESLLHIRQWADNYKA